MADIQEILQVVKEFKYWSNPKRFTIRHLKVRTRSYEILPFLKYGRFFIPNQLKRKHLHPEVSFPNSYYLSVKRLVQWPDLKKNTVFKQPPYLLWLRRDGLLVSPYPLDCYVVDLVTKNIDYIGPKWAIFSDKAPYHFFEKCLEIYVERRDRKPFIGL